jgi:hypothetical protein
VGAVQYLGRGSNSRRFLLLIQAVISVIFFGPFPFPCAVPDKPEFEWAFSWIKSRVLQLTPNLSVLHGGVGEWHVSWWPG